MPGILESSWIEYQWPCPCPCPCPMPMCSYAHRLRPSTNHSPSAAQSFEPYRERYCTVTSLAEEEQRLCFPPINADNSNPILPSRCFVQSVLVPTSSFEAIYSIAYPVRTSQTFSDQKTVISPLCIRDSIGRHSLSGPGNHASRRISDDEESHANFDRLIRIFKMPSLNIPESGLSFGKSAMPDSTMPTALGLTLTDGVIEEMIKCVQNGKPIQLSLGDHPVSLRPVQLCSQNVSCNCSLSLNYSPSLTIPLHPIVIEPNR